MTNNNNKITLHVGIDDTDSREGMCTTYIICILLRKFKKLNYKIEGYPHLIRLNPFARYKTRGNGALSFTIKLNNREEVNEIEQIVLETVEENADFNGENTNPGVVFYEGEITDDMIQYSQDAIYNILTIDYAQKFANKINARIHKFKKGRGIIGSIAAISCPLPDKTFELLAYRLPKNYKTERRLNEESVRLMNKETYPDTFDNVDGKYTAIEPHTPCPVLYGIRGNNPDIVQKAHDIVESYEEIEDYTIFKTNQHTDMHIQENIDIRNMKQYCCYKFDAEIIENPRTIEGGHIFITVSDKTGSIECAAYEPTKEFRNKVKQLRIGDKLTIYGGIGDKNTLNIEKFKLNKLASDYKLTNPVCCGKHMKSKGKGQGYKCYICGKKITSDKKNKIILERFITEGFYEVPTSARRHLSKPISRMLN
ncbi:MAG: tRNA(Ile)(2)-agmatinylcytidine synthase [Methanobacteriaceae archaeon]|nr:tRNA(Ile)(2)-agmatinylcytidine synthase [Methanobacteriaceae archaeon]